MSESLAKRRRLNRSPSPTYKLDENADNDYEPYIPVAQRRQAKLAALAYRGFNDRKKPESELDAGQIDGDEEEERQREKERKERTLLFEAQEVHQKKAAEDAQKTAAERNEEADAAILAAIASRKMLASDLELAKGIQYTEPLKSSCV
ncbi:hypothetical protein DFH11DRAFT_1730043 [Phellopilus nigrolimitatus]|nr:hypothetical protein DFH11DRAFT_1730043 [Phellopilus nigrolimitatus]